MTFSCKFPFQEWASSYIDSESLISWRNALEGVFTPGDKVIFAVENTLPHIPLLLTLLGRGISPLVVPLDSIEAERFSSELGAKALLKLGSDGALNITCFAHQYSEGNLGEQVQELGIFLLTSGSTGRASVVFRSMLSWEQEAKRYLELLKLKNRQRILLASPIYHAYSLGWLWAAIFSQANLEISKPTQLSQIVKALQERVTHCVLTPFVASLLARRVNHGVKPPLLEMVMAGAGPVDSVLELQFQAAFGLGLSRNYGSTESGALFAGIAPLPPLIIGFLMPNLRIENDGDHKAPFLLSVILEDGSVYKTGDIVKEGPYGYEVIGRETAAIRRGESWISPFEIESVLRQCPLVEDCQVRGVKSLNYSGNDHILASVVLRSGKTWDESQIKCFCREHLRESKVPDVVEQVTSIQRLSNGKPAKSKVYRISSNEKLIQAASAYKYSMMLFALFESSVLERLDGRSNVDQLALGAGLHSDALGELMKIAELSGLVEIVDSKAVTVEQKTSSTLSIVELENQARTLYNQVDSIKNILRNGVFRRAFTTQIPPVDFIARYQAAMNGQHKNLAGQLALRKLATLRSGPFKILDISATSAAYSKRFYERGLLSQAHCVYVGGLNLPNDDLEYVIEQSIAKIIEGGEKFDILVFDNAIHHDEVAKNLGGLTECLNSTGIVVLDEMFIGNEIGSFVGLDWFTHGGLSYLTEEDYNEMMCQHGFKKLEVMKNDLSVSHRLNLYWRV